MIFGECCKKGGRSEVGKAKEFQYILDFARGEDFDYGVSCDQLRSLWMAYCIHGSIDVDTLAYDGDILRIWNYMEAKKVPHKKWKEFRDFDLYMGEYLC